MGLGFDGWVGGVRECEIVVGDLDFDVGFGGGVDGEGVGEFVGGYVIDDGLVVVDVSVEGVCVFFVDCVYVFFEVGFGEVYCGVGVIVVMGGVEVEMYEVVVIC